MNSFKLEKDDYESLHDTIFNCVDSDFKVTKDVVYSLWSKLPRHIQGDVFSWGVADTVVRESIGNFIMDNPSVLEDSV